MFLLRVFRLSSMADLTSTMIDTRIMMTTANAMIALVRMKARSVENGEVGLSVGEVVALLALCVQLNISKHLVVSMLI